MRGDGGGGGARGGGNGGGAAARGIPSARRARAAVAARAGGTREPQPPEPAGPATRPASWGVRRYACFSPLRSQLPPTDLDGDGKPETITIAEEVVRVGKAEIPCESMDECMVECTMCWAPTSTRSSLCVRRGCRTRCTAGSGATTRAGPRPSPFPMAPRRPSPPVESGLVLTKNWERPALRADRPARLAKGKLVEVPQPAYYANTTVHIDRTFPIYWVPRTSAWWPTYARTATWCWCWSRRPMRTGTVRVSSGLLGWTNMAELWNVSDQVRMLNSAG